MAKRTTTGEPKVEPLLEGIEPAVDSSPAPDQGQGVEDDLGVDPAPDGQEGGASPAAPAVGPDSTDEPSEDEPGVEPAPAPQLSPEAAAAERELLASVDAMNRRRTVRGHGLLPDERALVERERALATAGLEAQRTAHEVLARARLEAQVIVESARAEATAIREAAWSELDLDQIAAAIARRNFP
jgi:hypothetical protein